VKALFQEPLFGEFQAVFDPFLALRPMYLLGLFKQLQNRRQAGCLTSRGKQGPYSRLSRLTSQSNHIQGMSDVPLVGAGKVPILVLVIVKQGASAIPVRAEKRRKNPLKNRGSKRAINCKKPSKSGAQRRCFFAKKHKRKGHLRPIARSPFTSHAILYSVTEPFTSQVTSPPTPSQNHRPEQ
jgi:hypothetical protein